MSNKQKALLANMRIIKPKKSEIDYEKLREALLHSDSMDGIINAGIEPNRRDHELRRFNDFSRKKNVRVQFFDEAESEYDTDMNESKQKNSKKRQMKSEGKMIRVAENVEKVSSKLQRLVDMMETKERKPQ